MEKVILETERLILRELTEADYGSLCKILQDEETLQASSGAEPLWSQTELCSVPAERETPFPRASGAKSFKSAPTRGDL